MKKHFEPDPSAWYVLRGIFNHEGEEWLCSLDKTPSDTFFTKHPRDTYRSPCAFDTYEEAKNAVSDLTDVAIIRFPAVSYAQRLIEARQNYDALTAQAYRNSNEFGVEDDALNNQVGDAWAHLQKLIKEAP